MLIVFLPVFFLISKLSSFAVPIIVILILAATAIIPVSIVPTSAAAVAAAHVRSRVRWRRDGVFLAVESESLGEREGADRLVIAFVFLFIRVVAVVRDGARVVVLDASTFVGIRV